MKHVCYRSQCYRVCGEIPRIYHHNTLKAFKIVKSAQNIKAQNNIKGTKAHQLY